MKTREYTKKKKIRVVFISGWETKIRDTGGVDNVYGGIWFVILLYSLYIPIGGLSSVSNSSYEIINKI